MKKNVTIMLLLLAAVIPAVSRAEVLTVCDGTHTSDGAPVYAYWMDRPNRSQMIYPAELLEAINGKTITGFKFYISSIGKAWTNEDLKVSLAETENVTFASAEYLDVAAVGVSSAAVDLATDATEWTITFSSPYVYKGGNLLVDIANPAKGSSPRINWMGMNQEGTTALAKGNNIRQMQFLPKLEITYTSEEIGDRATVSSKAVNFPLTFTDDSAERTVTVYNVGSTTVTGSLSVSGSDAFSVMPLSVDGIAPGESLDIDVTYAPKATSDEDAATLFVDLGAAGSFEIALAGKALTVPTAYRELFDGDDYAATLPADWTGWAEEILISDGSLNDATSDYNFFPSIYRFGNYAFDDCSGIAWNHVNWAPSSELYRQYYYLVSPALSGMVMFRAVMTDSPAAGCFVEVYPVVGYDELNRRFTLGDEPLKVDWEGNLTNEAWSVGTLNVPAGTRIAFFMKYAALDFVAADGTTGVAGVAAAPAADAVEVYDLAGRHISQEAYKSGNVPAGIYIVRDGAVVRKVLKK